MRVTIIILVSLISSGSTAQTNYGNTWMTGVFGNFMINFSGPQAAPDSFQNANIDAEYFTGGHSNICDGNGRLLLFTNGYTLFDSLGNVVMGGDTLVSPQMFDQENGYSSFTQSSLFLPMGGGIYYLIIPNATDSIYASWYTVPYAYGAYFDQLIAYKIDLTANAGMPKVVDTILLMDSVRMTRSMMMACKHSNGQDWWIVKQMVDLNGQFIGPYPQNKNKIAKILISNMGIGSPTYQTFPNSYMSYFEQVGQSVFSCDGSKYAVTCNGLNNIFLADFDRLTGMLSNPQFIPLPPVLNHPNVTTYDSSSRGVCFSPNSQFLYVTRSANIQQYDLLDTNAATQWYHVANLDTTIQWFVQYSNLYLGPDNKIYVGNIGSASWAMSYIDSPSIKGAGCSFKPKGFQYLPGSYVGSSAPPCMPYYDMDLLPCDTSVSTGGGGSGEPDGVNDYLAQKLQLKLYPNPATSYLYIDIQDTYSKYYYELVSLEGRKVLKGVLGNQINVAALQSGVYVLRIFSNEGSASRKVFLQ
jgi:hypothetical protein